MNGWTIYDFNHQYRFERVNNALQVTVRLSRWIDEKFVEFGVGVGNDKQSAQMFALERAKQFIRKHPELVAGKVPMMDLREVITAEIERPMTYIVSVSGGLGSAFAAWDTIQKYGAENVDLVFCDVKGKPSGNLIDRLLHERFGGESPDTYRFLWELSYALGKPIERLETSENIWDVFTRKKALRLFTGNSWFCPASEALKRDVFYEYANEHYYAQGIPFTIVLGMGWDEEHRTIKARRYWHKRFNESVEVISPLQEKRNLANCDLAKWAAGVGLSIPIAYGQGFSHNNCNSGCVQAGVTHFANLYQQRPDVYHYWAYRERQFQSRLGRKVTILTIERGGVKRPISLYDFIPVIQSGHYPKTDFGGCGCFTAPLEFEPLLIQQGLFPKAA